MIQRVAKDAEMMQRVVYQWRPYESPVADDINGDHPSQSPEIIQDPAEIDEKPSRILPQECQYMIMSNWDQDHETLNIDANVLTEAEEHVFTKFRITTKPETSLSTNHNATYIYVEWPIGRTLELERCSILSTA